MSCWYKVLVPLLVCCAFCLQHHALDVSLDGATIDPVYCIVEDWFGGVQDIPDMQAHIPFINHFAACQMCTATNPMMVTSAMS